jgi:hypothetical protein
LNNGCFELTKDDNYLIKVFCAPKVQSNGYILYIALQKAMLCCGPKITNSQSFRLDKKVKFVA